MYVNIYIYTYVYRKHIYVCMLSFLFVCMEYPPLGSRTHIFRHGSLVNDHGHFRLADPFVNVMFIKVLLAEIDALPSHS